MKLSLTIDPGGNDAFEGADFLPEMAHAVEIVAFKIRQGNYSGTVLDSNGNRVGEWTIS